MADRSLFLCLTLMYHTACRLPRKHRRAMTPIGLVLAKCAPCQSPVSAGCSTAIGPHKVARSRTRVSLLCRPLAPQAHKVFGPPTWSPCAPAAIASPQQRPLLSADFPRSSWREGKEFPCVPGCPTMHMYNRTHTPTIVWDKQGGFMFLFSFPLFFLQTADSGPHPSCPITQQAPAGTLL